MNRFVYSAILAAVVTSCSPSGTEQGESNIIFQFPHDVGGSEFRLGPRSRQWFLKTIGGVPLRKYDPQAAHEEPSGYFRMGEKEFYLFGMGLWEVGDPERWIWTSTYTEDLLGNLWNVKSPEEVKAVLDKLEHDPSFEFIPNTVQLTESEHYPIQEAIEVISKAETQEERDALMKKWGAKRREADSSKESTIKPLEFPERSGKFKGGDSLPEKGFKNYSELQEWSFYTTTGAGGCSILELGRRKVFYSDRMFTSGTATSELVFYTENRDGRIRPFLIVPVQLKENRVVVKDNKIVVLSYNFESKDWQVAMILTPEMLPVE